MKRVNLLILVVLACRGYRAHRAKSGMAACAWPRDVAFVAERSA